MGLFCTRDDTLLTLSPSLLTLVVLPTDVAAFEFTEEMTIFDSLYIPLYHGWIIDPQHPDADIIGPKSYNLLANQLAGIENPPVVVGKLKYQDSPGPLYRVTFLITHRRPCGVEDG